MIGLGYHATITPPVIRRNVLEDPSWYTAYTPYQPEISQGRLEALLNFQTVVGDLTGLPTANASLLDEGTAAAEAMTLVRRANRKATGPFVVDADALPQTIEVVRTRAEAMGIEVVVADLADGLPDGELCGVLRAVPRRLRAGSSTRGALIEDGARARRARRGRRRPARAHPARVARRARRRRRRRLHPALRRPAVLRRPARRLHGRRAPASSGTCPAGWSASRVDAEGRPAYRLALQTREQHIRRDKATSNICTAQVLLAVVASMYAVYHGPEGLRGHRARAPTATPRVLAGALREAGVEVVHDAFFDTVAGPASRAAPRRSSPRPASAGVHLRLVDADHVGISCSERTDPATLEQVLRAFGVDGRRAGRRRRPHADALPVELLRRTPFLDARGVQQPPIARPRCCATCGGCRRATTRSTAA